MTHAQHATDRPVTDIHAENFALSVSGKKIRISIQGKLGFGCWKTFFQARQTALREKLPLQVDVEHCNEADMAGIGALLIAIDRLGDIEIAGCTEKSRYWFSNLGICRGCSNSASGSACPARLRR